MRVTIMQKLFSRLLLSTFIIMGVSLPTSAINLDFGKLKNTIKKVKRATGDVPVEKEIEIGGVISATLLGAAPLVSAVELQQYVNQVGHWVAQQSERPDLPWTFGVIDSDNINAFAAPGGYVILTKGLVLELNNEAELAGVLGHEISHIIKYHHLEAMQKNARVSLVGDILVASSQEKNRKKMDKLMNAGTNLYAKGLDRKDEYEADRMGAVLASRAGYDPFAFLDVLTTLDSIKADTPSLALITKTHPPFTERLNKLDRAMDGKLDKYAKGKRGEDRFLKIKERLINY